jgi:tetratricopeptide (TPR) repeat protein
MDASLNDKGTLDGKARFEDRGDPELVLRLAYRNTPQNKWNELMQAISGGMGFGGAVSNVAAEQPENTSEPFWFTYDYHRADYSDWKERRISLPYPPLFLQELNEAQKKSKEALPLGSQQEFFYKASLKLPEGVQPITPSVIELKNDFAEYTSTYAFQGGVLVGTRHLITKVREVPGAQRAEYSAFVKQMEDDIQQWIILFGDFEQGSALHKGQALLSQGKFSDAVALLQKAQGEDANDKQIALALGTAYSRLPDEAKANAVFDKLIADKPDVATLNAVAYEYATANRRLGDALDYASRAVEQTSKESLEVSLKSAAPDDFLRMKTLAEEWDTLGWIKFRTGNYAEAEKYLESSYSLWPRPLVGQHLANTYEKLGKKREASNICRALLSVPLFQQEPQIQDELVAIQRRIGALPPEPPSTKGKSSNSDQFLLAEDSARTFKMPRKVDFTGKSKIARFKVAIQAEPVSPVVEYISGDLEMRDEAAELAKVNFRQPFPKEYPAKIIRAGWVSCSKFTNDCTLIFFPIADKPSYDSFTKDVE